VKATALSALAALSGYQPAQPYWSGGEDWMRSATMIC
jgi:hypothetical protein